MKKQVEPSTTPDSTYDVAQLHREIDNNSTPAWWPEGLSLLPRGEPVDIHEARRLCINQKGLLEQLDVFVGRGVEKVIFTTNQGIQPAPKAE